MERYICKGSVYNPTLNACALLLPFYSFFGMSAIQQLKHNVSLRNQVKMDPASTRNEVDDVVRRNESVKATGSTRWQPPLFSRITWIPRGVRQRKNKYEETSIKGSDYQCAFTCCYYLRVGLLCLEYHDRYLSACERERAKDNNSFYDHAR